MSVKTYHTDIFNKIMEAGKPPKKAKQKQVIIKQIKPLEIMTPLQESISKCLIVENIVKLPIERLENYADVRKALLNAGAKYKNNTFVFPSDAEPIIQMLMDGGKTNIKKEFQFFPTPAKLAQEMAVLANINSPDLLVLEPSAGQGAIVKALLSVEPKLIVHGYELMEANRKELEKIKDFVLLGNDFLADDYSKGTHTTINKKNLTFDRIVANPPFSKNQDITHVTEMYRRLNKGGRLVTITSCHWMFAKGKKETAFKKWLDSVNADIEELSADTFKESGTSIKTMLIIIDKP